MLSRKRRREAPPSIHPRNRYAEKRLDFSHLASLYPSFNPYVFSSSSGHSTIDWTDFNATRELTRILLLHDHGVHWWIPDEQLCPTVPNRSNYIHWIEDLLSSGLILAKNDGSKGTVRGFDIGTGANCIYPLLGASLLGWSFVGSDVTNVALEWAAKNVESNPHLWELIEIRNANDSNRSERIVMEKTENSDQELEGSSTQQSPILVGVVKGGENFDFCMCNPPFFESIEEAGLNPKTSCGGTPEEMVYPGGERAFITRIIDDSVQLKHSFRWFTSMVGRKVNLKFLISKLREVGVSVVQTTEFVQGRTARWGLAWSFMPPNKSSITSNAPNRSHLGSFTVEGLKRQYGAFQILKSVESFFKDNGVSFKSDSSSFSVDVALSNDQMNTLPVNGLNESSISAADQSSNVLTKPCVFRVLVFEQMPGTVLVRWSPLEKDSQFIGLFLHLFNQLEEFLKKEFNSKTHFVCGK
ncbi:23S rRNA (adenine1618-N6)-methyltransferase [Apostasia shenzhenica]|uniref:U6 small nuclear RNA (adenine-(43)-N(6))-methyltransferase n=1 Tax=Apostasia shenzhenica TaxID=1088818 RepID=A0A2I0AFH0_9ASPA|nr:23S rRNA (adenine1618-N6)-methyltransferase [Apostasia shenzhenica]